MVAWKSLDVRLLTMHHGRDMGGPEGPSESEPVRLAPVLAKRSRPSGYIVDAIQALTRGAVWPLPASPPSSQPARPCLASAWSSCRPMFRVKEVVSEASEMLRSSIPHAAVTSEAVGRHGIVIVTSDWVACSS